MQKGTASRVKADRPTRRRLIPKHLRPKVNWPHPVMPGEEIWRRTQFVWDRFYSLKFIWKRSSFIKSLRNRLAFVLISKLYQRERSSNLETAARNGYTAIRENVHHGSQPTVYLLLAFFLSLTFQQLQQPKTYGLDAV